MLIHFGQFLDKILLLRIMIAINWQYILFKNTAVKSSSCQSFEFLFGNNGHYRHSVDRKMTNTCFLNITDSTSLNVTHRHWSKVFDCIHIPFHACLQTPENKPFHSHILCFCNVAEDGLNHFSYIYVQKKNFVLKFGNIIEKFVFSTFGKRK